MGPLYWTQSLYLLQVAALIGGGVGDLEPPWVSFFLSRKFLKLCQRNSRDPPSGLKTTDREEERLRENIPVYWMA